MASSRGIAHSAICVVVVNEEKGPSAQKGSTRQEASGLRRTTKNAERLGAKDARRNETATPGLGRGLQKEPRPEPGL